MTTGGQRLDCSLQSSACGCRVTTSEPSVHSKRWQRCPQWALRPLWDLRDRSIPTGPSKSVPHPPHSDPSTQSCSTWGPLAAEALTPGARARRRPCGSTCYAHSADEEVSGVEPLHSGRGGRPECLREPAESEPCCQRAGVSPRCLACGPESCSRPCVRTVGSFVSALGILLCHSQASHPHRVPACHSPRDRLREDATPPRPALPGGSRSDHAPAQSCLTLDPTDHSPPAARQLLCPRHSPGRNTAVGCHTLLQRLFLTQGPNARLPHCRRILHQ